MTTVEKSGLLMFLTSLAVAVTIPTDGEVVGLIVSLTLFFIGGLVFLLAGDKN